MLSKRLESVVKNSGKEHIETKNVTQNITPIVSQSPNYQNLQIDKEINIDWVNNL
jgi:hypothetical protein